MISVEEYFFHCPHTAQENLSSKCPEDYDKKICSYLSRTKINVDDEQSNSRSARSAAAIFTASSITLISFSDGLLSAQFPNFDIPFCWSNAG